MYTVPRALELRQRALLSTLLMALSALTGCQVLCPRATLQAAQSSLEDGYVRRSLALSRSVNPFLCQEARALVSEAEEELAINQEELALYRTAPSPEHMQLAAREFREGVRRLKDDPAKAAEHLARSNELWPRPATLAMLARAYARQGSFARQRRLLDRTLTLAEKLTGKPARPRLPDTISRVEAMAFSPDGRFLATSNPQKLVLWDLTSLAAVKSLQVPHTQVLAFSPDAKWLAIGTGEGAVLLYGLETQRLMPLKAPSADEQVAVSAVAYGRGGELAAALGARILSWKLQGEAPVEQPPVTADESVAALAIAPGGRLLAALESGDITRWSPETEQWHTLESMIWPSSLVLSRDGTQAVVANHIGSILLLDVNTGKLGEAHIVGLVALAFSADDQRVLVLDSGWVIHQLRLDGTIETRKMRRVPPSLLASKAVIQPASGLAALSGWWGTVLFDWEQPDIITVLEDSSRTILALAFSPEGTTLAVAAHQSIYLWGHFGKTQVLLPGQGRARMAWAPGGDVLATTDNTTTRLWDTLSGAFIASLPPSRLVAFSPEGKAVALADPQRGVILRPLGSAGQERRLQGKPGEPQALAFAGDPLKVVAQLGIRVLYWDLRRGEEPAVLSQSASAISIAGSTLVIATQEGELQRIDLEQGGTHLLRRNHPVTELALSPDGSSLATGHEGGTVALLDASSGAVLWTGQGHTEPISALAFTPDGRTLASGGFDGVVALWAPTSASGSATPLARLLATQPRPNPHSVRASHAQCDWAILAEGGRVDGSAGGGELLQWDFDGLRVPGQAGWEERLANAPHDLLPQLLLNH